MGTYDNQSGREWLRTASFVDHGVADGWTLFRRVVESLDAPAGTAVRVDDETLNVVAAAFRQAFRLAVGADVPADVEAALDDAVAWTREEHGGELLRVREELLPSVFRRFVAAHDVYHGAEEPVVAA